MSSKLETLFQEVLAPVASELNFKMTRQDWGYRCSDIRLRNDLLELEIFHDIIDEASVRVRLIRDPQSTLRSYVDVLKDLLGSDFSLTEYLGGWSDRGFLPPDMPRAFAVVAETLPAVVGKLAPKNA